jgi:hypothetical protein
VILNTKTGYFIISNRLVITNIKTYFTLRFQSSLLKEIVSETESSLKKMVQTESELKLFMNRLEGYVFSLSDRVKSIEEQHTGFIDKLARTETNERKWESLCARVDSLEATGSGHNDNTGHSEVDLDDLNKSLDNRELHDNRELQVINKD